MVKDQGQLTVDVDGVCPVCYKVDMEQYGHSSGPPLFTWGALPCMNVVVHNRASSRGCLAHVWNSTLDGIELYDKAHAAVDKMLVAAGKPAAADIYLFAGQAFIANSTYQTTNKRKEDVDRFLARKYESHYVWNGLHHAMGQVLYWPAKNVVYFVSDAERSSLQDTMVEYGSLGFLKKAMLDVSVQAL